MGVNVTASKGEVKFDRSGLKEQEEDSGPATRPSSAPPTPTSSTSGSNKDK